MHTIIEWFRMAIGVNPLSAVISSFIAGALLGLWIGRLVVLKAKNQPSAEVKDERPKGP